MEILLVVIICLLRSHEGIRIRGRPPQKVSWLAGKLSLYLFDFTGRRLLGGFNLSLIKYVFYSSCIQVLANVEIFYVTISYVTSEDESTLK